MTAHRYPLSALCEALGCQPDDLKTRLHLDHKQFARFVENGLSERSADRHAVRLGLQPQLVWPEMVDHAIDDLTVECAERGCTVRFVPARQGHRYHSPACQQREFKREYQRHQYHTDPAYRQAKIDAQKRYRAESDRALKIQQAAYRAERREELRLRQRAYYEANRERVLARQREYDRARRAERAAA